MPTLTVDIPPAEYDRLERQAAAAGRTVEQEARARLVEPAAHDRLEGPAAAAVLPVEKVAAEAIGDWALRPGNDDTGPLDFPSLLTWTQTRVVDAGERLPALPVILELTPE